MGAAITGWGQALPDQVVTNDDFAKRLDTSDEWIVERTGIRERRMGGTTSGLAAEAGRQALAKAGLTGADIDLFILATTTPDKAVPASSSAVHYELGIAGGAFDLNAACAGFTYSLIMAHALIATGAKSCLVVGSETLSRITDQDDRSTAVLFGDGAAGIVLSASDDHELMLGHDIGVDGAAYDLIYAEVGGYMHMDGKQVFRRAVLVEIASITKVLDEAGVKPSEIAMFVPHQANARIIQAVNERLGLEMDRTAIVLDRTGNTSAASIPLALCDAVEHGRLHEGDLVLLSGFGAGMTWATALVRWGTGPTQQ